MSESLSDPLAHVEKILEEKGHWGLARHYTSWRHLRDMPLQVLSLWWYAALISIWQRRPRKPAPPETLEEWHEAGRIFRESSTKETS